MLQYSWYVRCRGGKETRGTGRYGIVVIWVGVLEPLAVGVCAGEDSVDDIRKDVELGGDDVAFLCSPFLTALGYCRCRDCPIKVGHSFIVHCLGREEGSPLFPNSKPRNLPKGQL